MILVTVGVKASAAQHRAERVHTAAKLLGHVVGDVEHTLVILRESGGEDGIADLFTVDVKLGKAKSGKINRRALNLLLDGKFLFSSNEDEAIE